MISKQFNGPPNPASASATIGTNQSRCGPALADLDLVGALQRAVDALGEFGAGVGGIERLVGIHRAGGVGVGRDLPARQIDGLEPGADHLHRLVAGHRAERAHRRRRAAAIATIFRPRAAPAYARSPPTRAAPRPRRPIGPRDPGEATGGGGINWSKLVIGSVLRNCGGISPCRQTPERRNAPAIKVALSQCDL